MNKQKIDAIAKEIMQAVDVDPEFFDKRSMYPGANSYRYADTRSFYRKIAKWHLKQIGKIEAKRQRKIFS